MPDVEVRSLGYRTDLMVRRLAGSSIIERKRFAVVRTPDNPWFHWGNFLLWPDPPTGSDLEEWSALFAEEFPEANHVAFGIDEAELPEPYDIPSSMGLEVEVSLVMTATQPPETGPADGALTIRTLSSVDDWHQELLLQQALEVGDAAPRGYREFLERNTDEARRLVEERHAVYVGAFSEGRLRSVVGIASDGQGVARYQNVGTHPDFRGRGYASALLTRAGSYGAEQFGADLLVIVADRDGPAAHLYQSVGFTIVEGQWGLSSPAV